MFALKINRYLFRLEKNIHSEIISFEIIFNNYIPIYLLLWIHSKLDGN